MDKNTYEALQRLVMSIRERDRIEDDIEDDSDLRQVEAWMEEVEKDYVGEDATE